MVLTVAVIDDEPLAARAVARLYRGRGCDVHVLAPSSSLDAMVEQLDQLGRLAAIVCDYDLSQPYTGADVLARVNAAVRILHSGSVSECEHATHIIPKGAPPDLFWAALGQLRVIR